MTPYPEQPMSQQGLSSGILIAAFVVLLIVGGTYYLEDMWN